MQDTKKESKSKSTKSGKIIRIGQEQLTKHLDQVVRGTVEGLTREPLMPSTVSNLNKKFYAGFKNGSRPPLRDSLYMCFWTASG